MDMRIAGLGSRKGRYSVATKTAPQISMDDKWLEDPALEELLNSRETAKEAKGRAASAFNGWDDKAKAHIETLNLTEDEPRRCGAFLVSVTRSKGKSVSFDIEGGKQRIKIRNAEKKED